MKKLSILLLFVILTSQGYSQITNITSTVNLGPINPIKKEIPTRTTTIYDTLQSPALASGVAVYGNHGAPPGGLGGYITGTNAVFTEIYMKYSLMNYAAVNMFTVDSFPALTEALVWVGYRTLGPSPGNVYSKAYTVAYSAEANATSGGTLDGGYAPGDSLGISDAVNMANIQGSLTEVLTSFKYSTPAPINNDSFFVSVLYSTAPGDTIAIAGSLVGTTVPFPSSGWVGSTGYVPDDFAHLIGHDLDLAIFPIISSSLISGTKNVNNITFASAMPNPASNELFIGYEIANSDNVKITLTDMLGRAVAEIGTKNMDSGVHTERIDVSSLSSGMYVYNIETASGNKTGKVYVSH
jgi:hypothetical protein